MFLDMSKRKERGKKTVRRGFRRGDMDRKRKKEEECEGTIEDAMVDFLTDVGKPTSGGHLIYNGKVYTLRGNSWK